MTHLSIFVVLSIVFIVVYLYYTISDVKKVHAEVKKITQDVEALSKSISNITTSIMPLLTVPSPSQPQYSQAEFVSAVVQPAVTVVENVQSHGSIKQQEVAVDDVSTADSEEIQNLMETIDDEEKTQEEETSEEVVVTKEEPEPVAETPANIDISKLDVTDTQTVESSVSATVDLRTLSVEDLKTKVSYEDMRRFLKSMNMNVKGTKEVLIQRIKGQTV